MKQHFHLIWSSNAKVRTKVNYFAVLNTAGKFFGNTGLYGISQIRNPTRKYKILGNQQQALKKYRRAWHI